MKPGCGYAKTKPNGKSLMATALATVALTVFSLTPGRGVIGLSRSDCWRKARWWSVGRAVLVHPAAIICVLGVAVVRSS